MRPEDVREPMPVEAAGSGEGSMTVADMDLEQTETKRVEAPEAAMAEIEHTPEEKSPRPAATQERRESTPKVVLRSCLKKSAKGKEKLRVNHALVNGIWQPDSSSHTLDG